MEQSPMKYCPVCENDYPDDVTVCPRDGAAVRRPGSRPDPFIGRVIRDRYRVERQLGKGGMGAVYLAEQLSVGRKVALKVLRGDFARDEAFVARFRQEAKLVAALNEKRNPYVTLVHDFDQAEDGSLFIVMEWLEGRVLNDVIQQEGALQLPRAIRLATQIAQGLEAAHRAGVIHRDVKPHNVMVLAATDDIKLMDFGIARLLDSTRPSITRAGTMMGTPDYMAPEQIDGQEVTKKTDIYSFGVVFYEMLTGTAPFRASTSAAVLTKQLRELPMPPRRLRADIPADVEAIVLRALEKDPAHRPRDMGEIVGGLREISQRMGQGLEPEPGSPAPTLVARPLPGQTIASPPSTPTHSRGQSAALTEAGEALRFPSGQSFVTVPGGGETLASDASVADLPAVDRPRRTAQRGAGLFTTPWSRALIVGAAVAAAVVVIVVTWTNLVPSAKPTPRPPQSGATAQGGVAEQGGVAAQGGESPAEPSALQPNPSELAPLWALPEPSGGAAAGAKAASSPPTGSAGQKPAPSKSIVAGTTSPSPESTDRLRARVEERLRSRSLLRGSGPDPDTGLTVEVDSERIVTLRGIVHDIEEREEAVRLAHVAGVTEVRPRINVQKSWRN